VKSRLTPITLFTIRIQFVDSRLSNPRGFSLALAASESSLTFLNKNVESLSKAVVFSQEAMFLSQLHRPPLVDAETAMMTLKFDAFLWHRSFTLLSESVSCGIQDIQTKLVVARLD